MPESPTPSAPQPEALKPPHTSLLARLLNVFATPGEVFEEVKNSGPSTANWLVPVLLSALVGVFSCLVIFSQPAIIQEMREMQAKRFDDQVKAGKMTQEQADKVSAATDKYLGPTLLKISGSIGAIVASVVRVFWWALILWLLGRWFLKARFSYVKTVEVAGLATMISVLGAIVTLLLTVNFGKMTTPSLAMMFSHSDPKNKLQMLFAALDLFNLWFVGVAAVGLARLAGARFPRALLLVAVYWLIFLAVMGSLGALAGGLVSSG